MLSFPVLYSYLKERFHLIPWSILPFLIVILSLKKIDDLNFIVMLFSYIAVLFFRLLDDIKCSEFDKKRGKSHAYFTNLDELIRWSLLLLVVFIATTLLTLGLTALVMVLSLIVLSNFAYHFFLYKPQVEYISLFKYPVFIMVIEYSLYQKITFWPLYIFLVFTITEIIEHKMIDKFKANIIQYSALLLLVVLKMGIV